MEAPGLSPSLAAPSSGLCKVGAMSQASVTLHFQNQEESYIYIWRKIGLINPLLTSCCDQSFSVFSIMSIKFPVHFRYRRMLLAQTNCYQLTKILKGRGLRSHIFVGYQWDTGTLSALTNWLAKVNCFLLDNLLLWNRNFILSSYYETSFILPSHLNLQYHLLNETAVTLNQRYGKGRTSGSSRSPAGWKWGLYLFRKWRNSKLWLKQIMLSFP